MDVGVFSYLMADFGLLSNSMMGFGRGIRKTCLIPVSSDPLAIYPESRSTSVRDRSTRYTPLKT